MRLKYMDLKRELRRRTGEVLNLNEISTEKNIRYTTLSSLSDEGKMQKIDNDYANISTTFFRKRGFTLDEIWDFPEDDGPAPQRKRKSSKGDDSASG